MNFRFLRSPVYGFGLICLLGISACTSSNSSPSLIAKPTLEEALSSAALVNAETTLTSQLQSNSPTQSQSQISVPVPNISPKFQTSLIAEAPPSITPPASSDIIAEKINTETINTKESFAVSIASPNKPKIETNRIANLEHAQITSQSMTTPNADTTALETASILKNKPKRKLNFFERLLKSRRDKIAANKLATHKNTLNAEILKLAALNPTSNNNNPQINTSLGVKEGIKLLEIEEGTIHDDNSSVELASVGALGRTAGPHGLILQTPGVQVACLKPQLLAILKKVERRFGKKIMVTSGFRSPARNRRAGGVKNSHHTTCNAADVQVAGISKWDVAKYLRSLSRRGGIGTYCRTKSVHVDTGSQRDWHEPCRRRKRRK